MCSAFVIASGGHAGHDRRENGVESLVDLSQAVRGTDDCAVNPDGRERHAGRVPNEVAEHDEVQPGNERVNKLVDADRRRVTDQSPRFTKPRHSISMRGNPTKELGCKRECYNSGCRGSEDCGHLGREFSETDNECKQKRKCCGNRFSHAARVDVVLHHFHSARNRSADAIPSAAGPSSRATRNVKIPRKFDANIPIVFKKAPRFSSTPVSSTRAVASAGSGETPSVISIELAGLRFSLMPANASR